MNKILDDDALERGLKELQGDHYKGQLACSRRWRECKKDFREHNTEQNRLLWAQWNCLTDVWTFCGPGAGGEPEKIFQSLAKKAVKGFPHSDSIPEGDYWKVWLDSLRNETRNFDEEFVELILSPQEWDKFALPATKGVVESVTITDKMAESTRRLGFSAEPGTKTQRRFEGIAGVIRDLFATSANYCLELEARVPHPLSREARPDEAASAQAAKAPPAAADKQSRRGKGVRSNVAIERVKQEIRRLHEVRCTQQQICERLGTAPRPMNAAWKGFTWLEAFRNPQYKAAVKSWISRVT
jgi:hypothetical protein